MYKTIYVNNYKTQVGFKKKQTKTLLYAKIDVYWKEFDFRDLLFMIPNLLQNICTMFGV